MSGMFADCFRFFLSQTRTRLTPTVIKTISAPKTALAALLIWLPISTWAAEYDAVLDWNRKAKLSTPVSGVVAKVNVQPGDRVNQDDVLLQLDNGVMKANLEKAKADVEFYERSFKEAQRELDRNQELYDRTLIAEHDLEMAKIQADDAVKDV